MNYLAILTIMETSEGWCKRDGRDPMSKLFSFLCAMEENLDGAYLIDRRSGRVERKEWKREK